MVKDINRIAVAATMRQTPGASNASATEASLSVIPVEDRPAGFQYGYSVSNRGAGESRADITVKADGLRPAVQISRGTVGAEVSFDIQKDAGQHIQVLTKEGVHIAGTVAISTSEANALMSFDTGFGAGAYTTTYLNRTGAAAYLDLSLIHI